MSRPTNPEVPSAAAELVEKLLAKLTPPPAKRKRDPSRIDCYEAFDAAELAGRRCWCALDMAIVSDLSAFAAVFPMHLDSDEEHPLELFRLLIKYWLPEETAKRLRDKVPYQQWAERGWIALTEGNEVDFTVIENEIAEFAEQHHIEELRYDRAYAAQLTQNLELRHGIPRAEFPQTIMNYTLPSKLFERLIKLKQIRHQGNPILTWQIGHVSIKEDNNNNIRPVRPKKGDHRTVDGVQATIMALSGALGACGVADDWDGTVEYV